MMHVAARASISPAPALQQRPPTILIVCLNGFSVRYLLRSDVLKTLIAGGAHCAILFEGGDDPAFQREFAAPNVSVHPMNNKAYQDFERQHGLARFVKRVRRYTLNGRFDTRTVDDYFRLHVAAVRTWRHRVQVELEAAGIFLLKNSLLARRLLARMEERLFTPPVHQALFDEIQPDLVVTTTLGYFGFEDYVMREARRNAVPITSVILSWDNPSSKGIGGARADRVITWTEAMRQEVVEFHDYDPSVVEVGGVAHFDDYVRGDAVLSREEFLREFDLDPGKRTIFFAAKSPSAYPWNPEIIECLAAGAADGAFVEPCQVIARVHPAQFVKKHAVLGAERSIQEINWERYEALRAQYPSLRLSVPKLRIKGGFDIEVRERLVLGSLLKHSDIVVNCFSTINLEAAIFDRPLVNVAFNGTGGSPTGNPRHNLALDEAQSHNQRVVRSGAIRIARTQKELIADINAYLVDSSRDRAARQRLVAQEAGGFLGKAGQRIGRLILEHVLRLRL